jgi:hypothetical protein
MHERNYNKQSTPTHTCNAQVKDPRLLLVNVLHCGRSPATKSRAGTLGLWVLRCISFLGTLFIFSSWILLPGTGSSSSSAFVCLLGLFSSSCFSGKTYGNKTAEPRVHRGGTDPLLKNTKKKSYGGGFV